MWKQTLKLSIAVFFVTGWLPSVAAPSVSSCGVDPPLPSGGIIWPVNGQVTQPWSLDCGSDKGHRGIDIAAPAGTSVKATAGGTIIFVGYTPAEGGGTTVSINHPGGLHSTYLHMEQVTVSTGQRITQGQPIGTSAGPAVHFGIKVEGSREQYFDPLPYLRTAPPDPEPVRPTPQPVQPPAAELVTPPAAPAPTAATVTRPAEPLPGSTQVISSRPPVPAGHPLAATDVVSSPMVTAMSKPVTLSPGSPAAMPLRQIAAPGDNHSPPGTRAASKPGSAGSIHATGNHCWPLRPVTAVAAAALIIIVGVSSGAAGRPARKGPANGYPQSQATAGC